MRLVPMMFSRSHFDDKRFVLDDGINTMAYFHKDMNNLRI